MNTLHDDILLRERRLQWLVALESDKFPQTRGALFRQEVSYGEALPDTQEFCCIGVAREILDPGWVVSTGELTYDAGVTHCNNDEYEIVRARYGLSRYLVKHLIDLNDSKRRDFRFIARFLRKVWRLTDA